MLAHKAVLTVRFGSKNTKDDVLTWSVPNRSMKTKKGECGLKREHDTFSKVSFFFSQKRSGRGKVCWQLAARSFILSTKSRRHRFEEKKSI